MNLDDLIKYNINNSRIYGVTKPSIIKEILDIPQNVDLKKLDKRIDDYYVFYIRKTWAKDQLTHDEKIKLFLNIEKNNQERFSAVPDGEDKTRFRKIVTINQEWLKKCQKKIK